MSDTRDPERDQVAPIPNDGPSMHDLVIADMAERKAHGLRKYNSLLQTGNGRSFKLDLYEELLDAIVYLRGMIEEEKESAPAYPFRSNYEGPVVFKPGNPGTITPKNSREEKSW